MSVTTFCISVIIYLSSILDRFFHNTWHCFSHSSVNNMAIVAAAVQRGVDLDPYASHLSLLQCRRKVRVAWDGISRRSFLGVCQSLLRVCGHAQTFGESLWPVLSMTICIDNRIRPPKYQLITPGVDFSESAFLKFSQTASTVGVLAVCLVLCFGSCQIRV